MLTILANSTIKYLVLHATYSTSFQLISCSYILSMFEILQSSRLLSILVSGYRTLCTQAKGWRCGSPEVNLVRFASLKIPEMN